MVISRWFSWKLMMPVAQLKNLRMSYQSYGDKSLPTAFLVMGLGMNSGLWPKKLIQLLIKRGLHVITSDNRDSGNSEHFSGLKMHQSVPLAIGRALLRLPVSAPYTLEDMALDQIALMDHLDIRQAHFVGISMGGMISQVAATIRPSRVKSLTAIMSASGNPRTGTGKFRAIYSLLTSPDKSGSPNSLIDHYKNIFNNLKSPRYTYDEESTLEALAAAASFPFDPKASERQLLAILASGDRTSQLKKLTVPTLIIHGEDDPLLPLPAGKELAEVIPGATLQTLPLMGHDLPPIHYETLADSIANHIWTNES